MKAFLPKFSRFIGFKRFGFFAVLCVCLLLLFSSCSKEFINPYDLATPADVWMPRDLKLDTLGPNKVQLFWEQDNRHIDGYVVQKFTNGQSKEYLVFRDTIDFIDSNVVESNFEATCPEIRYEVLARAGRNRSLAAGMQTPIYMPLSTPAYAGEDIMVTDTLTSVQLNAQPTLPGESGRWTIVSGTGGAFENDRQHNTRFTGTPCNAYILRWTKQGCTESYDELNVAFYPFYTTANAGSNQSFSDATTQTTLNANQPATGQAGIWTVVSGEGGVFADASSPTTQFTGQSCTAYVLKWSLSGNCFSSDDNVNISFFKAPTAANAGSNQTITTAATSVTLAANTPATGETGTWSIINGTGGSFSNTNIPNATFTGNACTAYTLRWTIQGQCSNTSDDVTIGFAQSTTTANAGIDQTITNSTTSVTLAANTPASGETGTWSVISGAGGSFSNNNSANATFTGNACTNYILQWSIQGPCSTSTDQISINFQQTPNTANAGSDQTITSSATSVTLAANLPFNGETSLWTVISGSGGVFANASSPTTQFTGQGCQSYTLKWTKTSCAEATSDIVLVIFNQTVSAADAGLDQSITTSSTQTTLNGNALQTGETGLWTIISGSGGSFSNASLPNAVFTRGACQNYILKWTKTSCSVSTSDDVEISFQQAVSVANAGNDFTATSLTVSLNANSPGLEESGVWTIASGNGGTISNINSPTSNFTGLLGQNYSLNWTIAACGNSSSDQVVINFPIALPGNGVSDIDGNNYTTQIIGTQEWMSENLKTTRFCNGDLIPNLISNTEWASSQTSAYSVYSNLQSNGEIFGNIYNGYTVTDYRNVCPCGWHVPDHWEWITLTENLGGAAIAGGKIKTIGTNFWTSPNYGATNESGFSGLPGGDRMDDGVFVNKNSTGIWWTSTNFSSNSLRFRYVYFDSAELTAEAANVNYGLYIRCIKN